MCIRLQKITHSLIRCTNLFISMCIKFRGVNQSIFSLAPLLIKSIGLGLVKGELFLGKWLDVGTIERLNKADR